MTPEYQEWILQAEILDLEGCPQCFPTDLPICYLPCVECVSVKHRQPAKNQETCRV